MPHTFDATLKEIIAQHPRDFAPVFGLPQVTPVSALNVDLSTLTAATDVAFGFGKPLTEIVDLNFQSGPDPDLPARLHLYNAAFHLRFRVPVRSVLILLRSKADAINLNGKLVYGEGQDQVKFPYQVVRMWQQPVESFLRGGVGLLPLAPLCQLPKPLPDALRKVVQEIDRRLAQERDRARAVRLMTAAFILTGMRIPKEDLGAIYSGVRIMHESTAYDMAIEEGLEKGLAKGRAEGRAEGLVEGRVKEARRILLRLGKQIFGKPASPLERDKVESVNSLKELEYLTERVLQVQSWEALLAANGSGQTRRRKKKE